MDMPLIVEQLILEGERELALMEETHSAAERKKLEKEQKAREALRDQIRAAFAEELRPFVDFDEGQPSVMGLNQYLVWLILPGLAPIRTRVFRKAWYEHGQLRTVFNFQDGGFAAFCVPGLPWEGCSMVRGYCFEKSHTKWFKNLAPALALAKRRYERAQAGPPEVVYEALGE